MTPADSTITSADSTTLFGHAHRDKSTKHTTPNSLLGRSRRRNGKKPLSELPNSGTCLPAEFAWGNAELLFEAGGEVGEGAETCHISYFRDVVFVLFEQLCGSIELVSLEEYTRILARKTLHLVVELRS